MSRGKPSKSKANTVTKTEVTKLKKKVALISRGIEKKYHDIQSSAKEFASDAPINGLSLISEGVGSGQRVGLKISPQHLLIQGKVTFSSTAGLTGSPVRLIVFKDRSQTGTLPLVTDVLEAANVGAMYKHLNKPRYQVISDTVIKNLSPDINVTNYTYFKMNKKLRGQIYYEDATSNQAGQGRNNLYVMFMADTTLASANTGISFNARLTYIDY